MSSKNGITTYLSRIDLLLFNEAVKLYGLKNSELLREIVHSWLFSNKLQIKRT